MCTGAFGLEKLLHCVMLSLEEQGSQKTGDVSSREGDMEYGGEEQKLEMTLSRKLSSTTADGSRALDGRSMKGIRDGT